MTQFLLIQTRLPLSEQTEGLRFYDAAQVGHPVAEAASALFPRRELPVWKVAPSSGEADELADEARDAVLRGDSIATTRLGCLLGTAIDRKEAICLFWADDFLDLPTPRSKDELFALLENQLRTSDNSNYELYARWHSDA